MKNKSIDWEKIFANDVTNMGLVSKMWIMMLSSMGKKKKEPNEQIGIRPN